VHEPCIVTHVPVSERDGVERCCAALWVDLRRHESDCLTPNIG
jgi:hypothetical protein